MNLNDYPTPKTSPYSGVWATYWKDGITIFELAQQLEREAAAWRDVATMLCAAYEATSCDIGASPVLKAFDRLLAETSKNNEH